jgi:hypothetical protein
VSDAAWIFVCLVFAVVGYVAGYLNGRGER